MSDEKKKTGFAKLSREELQEISRRGGISCHKSGNAYKFTSETAKKASDRSRGKKEGES